MVSVMSAHLPCGRESLDVQVDADGEQEHDPEEGLEPVRVPACVDDAQAGHAEDECTDGDADGVPVAAGEPHAAHDRRDDVEELVADAVAGLQDVEVVEVVHPAEPAQKCDRHEQANLYPHDGHTDGSRGTRVPTNSEDPVTDLGARQHVRREHGEQQPPDDRDLQVTDPIWNSCAKIQFNHAYPSIWSMLGLDTEPVTSLVTPR